MGSFKRRVRSHAVRKEIKNCTPLWREAHLQVKMLKNWQCRTTFWSSDVGKLHAVVARSTFASENVEKLTVSDYFLQFRCRKIAPLWREAYFQVKMSKARQLRTTFWISDVKNLHATVARSTCVSQKVQNTCVLAHFLNFRCRKISQLASSSVNQSVR